ncbi:MAG TPA: SRPBCC family protein [Terracidiphilus sp.]|jgi:uncharacterized protein YndB with AHSA1/START domain|nr:SRPBCC family protein [Terracidiphilus sp.]HEX4286896.1 SRPBCC family protein [Terracidiphilus sp.]
MDRIEKRIELKSPVARVWRALTNSCEFGAWFLVKLDTPFVEGQIASGQCAYPGYEHVKWEAHIQKMEPEKLFSFTWPLVEFIDKERYTGDYTAAPRTLVEFRLQPTGTGTLLTLTESGFEAIPSAWRERAFHGNDAGWAEQMKNIENYVAKNA